MTFLVIKLSISTHSDITLFLDNYDKKTDDMWDIKENVSVYSFSDTENNNF